MKLLDVSTPKYPNTFAMVDDEDFDFLNQWKWHPKVKRKEIYVARNENKKTILLHGKIMPHGKGLHVDHRNRNGLDNRKENLRVCTSSENQANAIKPSDAKGRFKGVYFASAKGLYISRITFKGALLQLGAFKNEIDAAMAYNKKAIDLFGEFARINEILHPLLDTKGPTTKETP